MARESDASGRMWDARAGLTFVWLETVDDALAVALAPGPEPEPGLQEA